MVYKIEKILRVKEISMLIIFIKNPLELFIIRSYSKIWPKKEF